MTLNLEEGLGHRNLDFFRVKAGGFAIAADDLKLAIWIICCSSGGLHACIGRDLAAGLSTNADAVADDHLFGLVPEAVQTMFDHNVRPDPDDPPEMDASTTRPYFARYPVLIG